MGNVKRKKTTRLLAALLALLMVLSTVPSNALTAVAATTEHPNAVTITVKDEKGKVLKGAEVEFTINSLQDNTEKSNTLCTNENGIVEVMSANDFVEGAYEISAKITATEYDPGELKNVMINTAEDNFEVVLNRTKALTANENLVYNKKEQELVTLNIAFQKDDRVTWVVNSKDSTWTVENEKETNIPKETNAGEYEVTLIVERKNEEIYNETVTTKISKAKIEGIAISVKTLFYNEKDQELVQMKNANFQNKDRITWSVNDVVKSTVEYSVWKKDCKIPKAKEIGTYTVKLKVERGDNYELEQEVETTISKGTIDFDKIGIVAKKLTYTGEAQEALLIPETREYNLWYQFGDDKNEESWNMISDENKPIVTDAGTYVIWIKAENIYYKNEQKFEVTVEQRERGIKFKNEELPKELCLEYTGNGYSVKEYDFSAQCINDNEISKEEINYEVKPSEIASIDASGRLEVKRPGEIIITASLAGNDNNKESVISHTLNVKGVVSNENHFISFENDETESYILGTNEGIISEKQVVKKDTNIDGIITYSIDTKDNKNINECVKINTETGELSVNNYNKLVDKMSENNGSLEIKVKAEKEETDYYGFDFCDYTIKIVFEKKPDDVYRISQVSEENGWYKDAVVVEAPERFLISQVAGGEFKISTTFSDQGEDKRYIHLKNQETGGITDKIPVDIKIDTIKPIVKDINYSNPVNEIIKNIVTIGFYKPKVTVTLTAEDATSGIAMFNVTYKENGSSDEEITKIIEEPDIHYDEQKAVYYAKIEFTASKIKQYKGHLTVSAKDYAGNSSEKKEDENNTFVVDNIKPELLNIRYIADGQNIVEEQETVVEEYVGEIDQFDKNHYYDQNVEVDFIIKEANFYQDDVEVYVEKDNKDSELIDPKKIKWEEAENEDTYIGSFLLDGDGSYIVSIEYIDKSDNKMESYTSETIVVDTTAPVFEDLTVNNENNKQYNNEDVKIAFKIIEANFYQNCVNINVTKDGKNCDYESIEWGEKDANNEIIGTITLKASKDHTFDGEYKISIKYSDPSGNVMHDSKENKLEQYDFDPIIIDTIAPVIDVKYQNKKIINTLKDSEKHSRKYFDKTQTAEITIKERNFDASKVDLKISAKDVAGNLLDLEKLCSISDWSSDGDNHRIKIEYSKDANYTFDITCEDKAKNKSDDYAVDYFTVDTKVPTNLRVYYSNSILDTILESISFGFYNAKVTVTLVAEDVTSEINSIVYSYVKARGVSSVNAEKINQTINADAIRYSTDRKTATAVFEIPKDVLNSSNQFNGTVEFRAVDRAGNISETYKDAKRIVVDTIAPTATVSYNNAANVVGDVSYYDGSIQATVTVNEANFYASDVKVIVSKDGGEPVAVSPSWHDNTADIHVGTFTITGDGDYIVTINYTDKSANKMTSYSSKKMVIDTKIEAPTYTINGVAKSENGGAYKGDAGIGFGYTDQNYDTATIKLTRTRFDKVEDVTKEFVQVSSNDKGGSGRFDIPVKVENDGIYVLTIGMTDKAKHSVESKLTFTVNRFGSVYEYSDELVSLIKDGGQYVKSVDNDLVITEYNADEILEESLQLLVTRDGENVDVDFENNRVNVPERNASNPNGWYQYTYKIKAANFKEDGVYKISLTSAYATADSATNDSTSVPENSVDVNGNKILDTMTFTVDSVAPEIRNVINLDQKIVDVDKIENGKLPVKYTIVDVGGLKSIEIMVNEKTVQFLNEEDLAGNTYNYTGTFDIEEQDGTDAQQVRIVATDFAGNVTDTDSDEFLKAHSVDNEDSTFVFMNEVTISRNFFIRWFANKPLFWGSIGSVVVVIGAACVLVLFKKKKEENW